MDKPEPVQPIEPRSSLLIVWHSRTGAARALAEAAADGARWAIAQEKATEGEALCVTLIRAGDCQPDDLQRASGVIFACPENLASMTGEMKEFFDRSYYPLLGQIEGKSYAAIIAAGSDGQGAAQQLDRIVTGWRMRAVSEPLIVNIHARTIEEILQIKQLSAETLEPAEKLGAAFAAGLLLGIY